MTHLTESQHGALDRLRRTTGTVACARCGGTVQLANALASSDRVTLCGNCGRDPFATGIGRDPSEIAKHLGELRRANELAHEALGLAGQLCQQCVPAHPEQPAAITARRRHDREDR